MTASVFAAALLSALLHVCWNSLAKASSAPRDLPIGISLATSSLCVLAVPFVSLPPAASLPWILASTICNVVFLHALTEAYARSEFGVAYAIVRAVVPPVMFVVGWLFLKEPGRFGAGVGLAFVIASLVLFACARRQFWEVKGYGLSASIVAGLALAFALLFDVKGIRTGGSGFANLMRYSVASSLATATALTIMASFKRTNSIEPIRGNIKLCYVGASLLLLSYVSGMWAYSQGPIGLVAPLRESGILFGGIVGVVVLRERISRLQWVAMMLATVGIILVQFA